MKLNVVSRNLCFQQEKERNVNGRMHFVENEIYTRDLFPHS